MAKNKPKSKNTISPAVDVMKNFIMRMLYKNSTYSVAAPEIQCYQVIARSITQPTRSTENRETLCHRATGRGILLIVSMYV